MKDIETQRKLDQKNYSGWTFNDEIKVMNGSKAEIISAIEKGLRLYSDVVRIYFTG